MIRTQNLSKRYGRVMAVDRLNLTVRTGTLFGLVGENGAGKTTTLGMLATLIRPSSGRALICGFDVTEQSREVRRCIGYMPDRFGVFDDITAEEYLQFYADCYHVPRPVARRRIDEWLAWVDLTEKRRAYVNALSRGMQQRLEIARCLMHDPAVLILDEPASGLDPRSRLEMRSVLQRLRDLGKTVLMSSHILHELAEVADEIGILRTGSISMVASVSVLREQTGAHRRLWLVGEASRDRWHQALRSDPHVVDYTFEPDGITVIYAGTLEQQAELMERLVKAQIRLYQFAERPTDIEQVFLRLTEGQVQHHGR
ncbi:MAG: ABC transporter ATP-binding protein [Thermoflavifilum sp.]|nr:ABC transporter ATP-binding protein [Thermoflavifilum sp.]MCL6512892.1 ABC transporter ATP-binding protein [Alicyclobacillus sp.]